MQYLEIVIESHWECGDLPTPGSLGIVSRNRRQKEKITRYVFKQHFLFSINVQNQFNAIVCLTYRIAFRSCRFQAHKGRRVCVLIIFKCELATSKHYGLKIEYSACDFDTQYKNCFARIRKCSHYHHCQQKYLNNRTN